MKKPDEMRQGMKVRTVVTGHDAKGRDVLVRDEQVDGTPILGRGSMSRRGTQKFAFSWAIISRF